MRRQLGFLSTCLHRAVASGARFAFINMAEWKSAEHFAAAVNSPEFIELVMPYMKVFPNYSGLAVPFQIERPAPPGPAAPG